VVGGLSWVSRLAVGIVGHESGKVAVERYKIVLMLVIPDLCCLLVGSWHSTFAYWTCLPRLRIIERANGTRRNTRKSE